MNRRLLALAALLVLVVTAGCSEFGRATTEEGLTEEATYDWETNATATIDVAGGEYTAIYGLSDRQAVRLYRSTAYGDDRPLAVRAVQFRHTNGTVVNASEMEITETREAVVVDLPAEEGQLAFTASTRAKQFGTRTFVEGSYEVVLPANHRVDNFVLATVRPGGYETSIVDDRVHLRWDDVTSRSVQVRYFLDRDRYLLAGLVVVVGIAGLVGMGYVWRQIRELRRRREELGLDVDVEDDRRRPPPGMR